MFQPISNLGYGGEGLSGGYLAQTVGELQGLAIAVLAGANANTGIPVAKGLDITDTPVAAIMFAGGVPSDITSTMSVLDRRATGTLTLSGVVAGDTVTINGKVFTCTATKESPSNALPPGQFSLGSTDAVTAANLAKKVSGIVPTVIATSAGAVVTLTVVAPGTAGNAYTLVGGTHVTASGATFVNGSATSAVSFSGSTSGNQIMLYWFKKPNPSNII